MKPRIKKKTNSSPPWKRLVENAMKGFAASYSAVYSKKERELCAFFEIGCFLSLVQFYEHTGFTGSIENPCTDGGFRYLTTPNGNPDSFSYLSMTKGTEVIHIRQQVRIVSHLGKDIAFTPDLVVIPSDTRIRQKKDTDYASGRRRFFHVSSESVIAAHECKSMPPFPELMVSYLGILLAAHAWLDRVEYDSVVCSDGDHLAPTLFVGGTARALHLRMIKGMKNAFPLNIVVGLHSGTWDLFGVRADIRRLSNPLQVS